MIILPPKPASEVSSLEDRFQCVPYRAVIFARVCVSRQDMLGKPRDARTGDYTDCEGCALGASIRTQVGAGVAPATNKAPAHGPGFVHVPRMPGRRALPVVPREPAEAPPPPKPLPPPRLPKKPPQGSGPERRAIVFEPPEVAPTTDRSPKMSVEPTVQIEPPPLPEKVSVARSDQDVELAEIEERLTAIHQGLLKTSSKVDHLLADVRDARARLARWTG